MNPTSKTIITLACVAGLGLIGYAIYRKVQAANNAPKPAAQAPANATNASGGDSTANTVHAISDSVNALAGLYNSYNN